MLNRAASEPGIPVTPEQLDADPWLLNVQNGTVNLRTGTLQPHDRRDLITAMAPVEYDPHGKCPLWRSTLEKILPGDDLRGFFQRLCGVALTGDCSEQILPILYGVGANGKSTVLNVLLEILGNDYGISAPPGLLILKRGEPHPTERAILHGKRLVVDVESAEGARLHETLVKQLTGSDKITARRMHEDFWSFAPTHKLMLCTNHKPEIRETKAAIWRRVKLVPFTVTIPESEQIKDLPQRLRAEYPAILAWCVHGCIKWQKTGLQEPEEVTSATREYRAEQDTLGEFLTTECVANVALKDQLRSKAGVLYERYRKFTEGSGEPALSQKAFGSALMERGFERFTNNGTWYRGIGLRSDEE